MPATVRLLEERPESPCVYHLFPARFEDRDTLVERLRAVGIETGVHYAPAVHGHPAWNGLAHRPRGVARRRGMGGRGAVSADASRPATGRDRTRGRGGAKRFAVFDRLIRRDPMLKPTTLDGRRERCRAIRCRCRCRRASAIGGRTSCASSPTTRTSRCAGSATSIASGSRSTGAATRRRGSPRGSSACSATRTSTRSIIATPVHTHYELAAQALEAGKHVFVEKPLAPSSELADDLAELASERRPHPDVRPHVRVQPAGARGQADARSRNARRHLLHLVEPREPRSAPARSSA